MKHRQIRAWWLGRRRYGPVHALQQQLMQARMDGRMSDTLLLVEHEPVITLGRGAKPEHVLMASDALAARGVDLFPTERGGDVTYHGPGQMVGYPIIDLAPDRCDVRRYVRDLQQTMILLGRDHGIDAGLVERHVGVWVDLESPQRWPGEADAVRPAKIGAVGVRISRWVTMHGFAFNACTELDAFSLIVPCGICEYGVTSLERLIGHAPAPEQLARRAAEHVCSNLSAQLEGFETLTGSLDGLVPPA